MKRTPMRRRRKRLPTSERDLLAEYAANEQYDEILWELGIEFSGDELRSGNPFGCKLACETNHLWSKGRRPNVQSNLIRLATSTHRWFHRHLPEGRTLCTLAKIRKRLRTGRCEEYDTEEANKAAGCRVFGVLSGYRFEPGSVMEAYQFEVCKRLEELEKEDCDLE